MLRDVARKFFFQWEGSASGRNVTKRNTYIFMQNFALQKKKCFSEKLDHI